MPACYAVIDLGFGDAGKGMATHGLVRALPAGTISVRFNGGAQAGHTVIDERGRRHVFSQFGAATFADAPSIYANSCVFHPTALLRERAALTAAGGRSDLLAVSAACLVTTPYHQAANRARERSRASRHGSCGVGVGETVQIHRVHPDATVRAGDLGNAAALRAALAAQQAHYAALADATGRAAPEDAAVLRSNAWWSAWIDEVQGTLGYVRDEAGIAAMVAAAPAIVFEGAQGMLLDEDYGFAPHTTPSRCDTRNISELLANWQLTCHVQVWGVTRSYMVRHGPGPLPTEHSGRVADTTNRPNEWQGPLRSGALDLVLLAHARRHLPQLCALAVSHLDDWDHSSRRVCTHYTDGAFADELVRRCPTTYPDDPWTARLATATPVLSTIDDIVGCLQTTLDAPVRAFGRGADATAWRIAG